MNSDPIAGVVEFEVFHDGDTWVAREYISPKIVKRPFRYRFVGRGGTPITALMVAEAKARKAAKP